MGFRHTSSLAPLRSNAPHAARSSSARLHRASGFTLLEVMVALAIFAVAAIALTNIAMNYTNSIGQMNDRTYGHFVAMNELARLEVNANWPEGTGEKNVEEQGRQWLIKWQAINTLSENIRRIEISVAPIPEGQDKAAPSVSHLTAFIQRPAT
jgi:general secretion pathway protein I